MDNNHLGKCLYCGFDIQYSGNNSVVKCKACGKALKIADFEQERVRFELERQRAEQAEKEIETARQEKRQAEERLHRTLSLLGDISLAQSEQKKEFGAKTIFDIPPIYLSNMKPEDVRKNIL